MGGKGFLDKSQVQDDGIVGRSCLRTIDVACLAAAEPGSFLPKYLNVEKLVVQTDRPGVLLG